MTYIRIKADIDDVFITQRYYTTRYKELGIEVKNFIYICQGSIYLIFQII